MNSRTQWTSRTVTDVVGTGGSVELNEELVARAQLADWLDAEYSGLDEDDEAWLMDVLTGTAITDEDREAALAEYGLVVEFNN